jgi:mono/diheme cytochrome c family protein
MLLVVVVGCGSESFNPASPRHDAGPDDPNAGVNGSGVGAGTGANTGLPCDIQQLLENRCIGCHLGTSPPPLLDYANLAAPSPGNPSITMAADCLGRMKNPTNPMPPPPAEAPSQAEIDTFQAWVDAKLPRGTSCAGDGGAPLAATFATPTVCTSGKSWNGGNDGSSSMHPGDACITCHTQRGGPAYKIAGTVYPTAHEPNECYGIVGGITVVVTDAKGVVTNITVNGAGNFYSRAVITPPFNVKVTSAGKERAMQEPLTAGDCNSCHTEQGLNGAPGRIVAP